MNKHQKNNMKNRKIRALHFSKNRSKHMIIDLNKLRTMLSLKLNLIIDKLLICQKIQMKKMLLLR